MEQGQEGGCSRFVGILVGSLVGSLAGSTCRNRKEHRLMGRVSGTRVELAPCNKLKEKCRIQSNLNTVTKVTHPSFYTKGDARIIKNQVNCS